MVQITILDECGSDEDTAEAWNFGNPMQLLKGEVHVLQRNHRRGEKPVRCRLAEIGYPVVVRTCERIRHVGILDQRKALSEPGWVEECLINPHRVHVTEPRLGIPRGLI